MFFVASGADVVINEEVASGFKECEWMNGFNHGFEKCKVILRKPSASVVDVKS